MLFLHGWGGNEPRYYRPWLEHLAREGDAVIYPRYQDSVLEPPPQVLGNVLAGVRLALERIDEDPGSLVVAGHSAGGALAADYAAIARGARLPVPEAMFPVYPAARCRACLELPRSTRRGSRAAPDVALAGARRPGGRDPAGPAAPRRRSARAASS